MTYKGFKGYMPIVGHLAENGLVIYAEFRQGNVAPSAKNLEFIKHCEGQMPKGNLSAPALRQAGTGRKDRIFKGGCSILSSRDT